VAYRLEQGESFSDGLSRIAREELDDASAQLRDGVGEDAERAVHEARKSLKKARALVRLERRALRGTVRRDANERLRDAGRRLSALRDQQVALRTLDDLAERYPGRLSKAAFTRIRRALRKASGGGRDARAVGATAAAVAAEVEAAREEVDAWSGAARRWKELEPGLARTYGRGREAFAAVESSGGDQELHAWRKRVKDLWYHQRVLEPLWPGLLEAQAGALDELGELLGSDQDLANLRRTLLALDASHAPPAADLDPLVEVIDARRTELQGHARALGRRVYAERAKLYARRHRSYAAAWEAEARRTA
jgi:hypothetical protein